MGVSIPHGWISGRLVIKDFVACVHRSLLSRSKPNSSSLYEPDRPRVELLEAGVASAEAQAGYTSRDKQPIRTNALHRHNCFCCCGWLKYACQT